MSQTQKCEFELPFMPLLKVKHVSWWCEEKAPHLKSWWSSWTTFRNKGSKGSEHPNQELDKETYCPSSLSSADCMLVLVLRSLELVAFDK